MFTSTAVKGCQSHCALRSKRERREGERRQTGMAMGSPPNLGSPTDDICEDIRCGPGVRVIYQAVYLIICGIVDSESLRDELFADVGG